MRSCERQNSAKAFTLLKALEPSRRWVGYTVAVVGTVVAVLIRWLVQRTVVGELQSFTTFYPVVFLAALLGGTGPGLLATVLGGFASDFFFVPPIRSFGPVNGAQAVSFMLFILVNLGVSLLGGWFHNRSEALRESESRLRLSQQIAHIGSFEYMVQTGESFRTPEMEMMHGLEPNQFPSTKSAWQALIHPEDRARVTATVDRAFKTFRPEEDEWRVVWPDGSIHWLVGRFRVFPDRAGKPFRFVGVNMDITERKKAADALRKSEERLRAWTVGGAYAEYRMGPDWAELRDVRGHQFIADTDVPTRTWMEQYIPPEEQTQVRAVIDQAMRAKSPIEHEHRIRRADGSIGWALSRVIPVVDAQGNVTEWFGTAQDVTKRKEAEQAVYESEAWFRTMADAIPHLIWSARADGYFMWFNQRCFEYLGLSREQLEGISAWEKVIHPDALPRVVEKWQRSIATGEPFHEEEFPLLGHDGVYRPFLATVMPLKDDEGRVLRWFGTATDISQLRKRERDLARQARLLDLSPTATIVHCPDGTITFWSEGAERLYGWTKAEAMERRIFELLRTEYPEPRQSIIAKLHDGGVWFGELKHSTRDGRRVVVESCWVAELNRQGHVEDFLESNTDITQRKQLQENLEEEVEKRTVEVRETLAELEHMSYSMIHDMRAPLRSMQSFSYILEEEVPACRYPPGSDYLQRIRQSSIRLDRLITGALNYNRLVRKETVTGPIDVGALLHGMIDSYPNLHVRVADISMEFDNLFVVGNESLLTQCFGNILDNAVKFVAPGVRPAVRIWAQEMYRESAADGAGPEVVRIWIEDNGIGIPKESQQKIFRMFQRIHRESEYPGTGIGLAIVRKTIERMQGHLGLESEPGKGSKFWVELPKAIRRQPREHIETVNCL